MDAAWVAIWALVLVGGGAFCALLFRWGVPRTYVRDLLHVGAGSWVFGWPLWSSPWLPAAIPVAALLLLLTLPLTRFREALSDEDERWSGILLYTASFAALTPLGVFWAPFPAAAGLLALSLGDGIGGLVGRRFGRRRFQLPFAKPKSVEGTLAVFFASGIGILLAARWFDAELSVPALLAAALAAAAAEAMAPRTSDNLLVPGAVLLVLLWL